MVFFADALQAAHGLIIFAVLFSVMGRETAHAFGRGLKHPPANTGFEKFSGFMKMRHTLFKCLHSP